MTSVRWNMALKALVAEVCSLVGVYSAAVFDSGRAVESGEGCKAVRAALERVVDGCADGADQRDDHYRHHRGNG